MGYTTNFDGGFDITPTLKKRDKEFLLKLSETRRMGRIGLDPKYGIEGEFYVEGKGDFGQERESSIIDYNKPPSTQPGLWCQWVPNKEGTFLEWNGGEKFYEYVAWLEYIIDKILAPKGYVLNGDCAWQGEESDDKGIIRVKNNVVTTAVGRTVYDDQDEPPETPHSPNIPGLPEGSPKVKRTRLI
jgi:hypothetical protein